MRRALALLLLLCATAAAPSAGHAVRVLSSDPAEGATGLPCRGLVVRLTFSHAMDAQTLSRETVQPGYTDGELRFFRDPFREVGYTWDAEGRTLSVALPGLLPAQEIALVVTDGARTLDGRPLDGEGRVRHRLLFRTAACE